MARARTQTPPIMARGHDEPRAAAPRIERATPHMTQAQCGARRRWPADERTRADAGPGRPARSSARDAAGRRRAAHHRPHRAVAADRAVSEATVRTSANERKARP